MTGFFSGFLFGKFTTRESSSYLSEIVTNGFVSKIDVLGFS